MKMSAKPFIKTRAHFLSDVHRVRRLNWCSDMKRRIVVPAAAGGWIFSCDLSRVSARDVKDVSRISAKTVSRFARLTLSPTFKHNTLPSNETRVHILTNRRNWGTRSTACQKATRRTFYGPLETAKNHRTFIFSPYSTDAHVEHRRPAFGR